MKSTVIVFCVLLFCSKVAPIPLEEPVHQKAHQPSNWQGNPNTAEHDHGSGIARTHNINSMSDQDYNVNQDRQQLNNYGFNNHPPSLQSLPMEESQVNFASTANKHRSGSFPPREYPYPLKTDSPPLTFDSEKRGKQNWPSQNQFLNPPSSPRASTVAAQQLPLSDLPPQRTFDDRDQNIPLHTRPANYQQYQANRTPPMGRDTHYHQTAEIPERERHVPRSGPVSELQNRPVRYVNHNEAPGAAINTINQAKAGNRGYEENSPSFSGRAKSIHYGTFHGSPASIADKSKSMRNTNNYLKPRDIYNGHALPLDREINNGHTGYNRFPNNQVPYNQLRNYQVPNNQLRNNQIPNNQGTNDQVHNNQIPNNHLPNNQVPNYRLSHNRAPNYQVPNNHKLPDAYENPIGQSNTAADNIGNSRHLEHGLKISEPTNDNRYGEMPAPNPRSNDVPSIHNPHTIDKTVITKYIGNPASNFEPINHPPMNTYNGVLAVPNESTLPTGEGNPPTNPKPVDSYNVSPLIPIDTPDENSRPTHHVSGPSNSSPPEEVNLYKGFFQHVSTAPGRENSEDSYLNSKLEKIFSSHTNRYVIIHPNGTVENIDRLDQIKDSDTNYILVKKKEPSVDDYNNDSLPLNSPSTDLGPALIDGQPADSLHDPLYKNPSNGDNSPSRALLQNNNNGYKHSPVLQPGNDYTASPVSQSPSSNGYNPPAQPHTGTDYASPVGPLIPNYNGYNPLLMPQSLTDNEYNDPTSGAIWDNNPEPPSKLHTHISPNGVSTITTEAPEVELVEKYLDSLPDPYRNPSPSLPQPSSHDQKLPNEPLDLIRNNNDHENIPTSVNDHTNSPLKLHTVISPGIFTSATSKPKKESVQDFVDSVFHSSKDDSLSVVPLFDPSGDNNDCSPRRLHLDDNDYELYSSALDDNCTMPLSSTTSPSTVHSATPEDGQVKNFLASLTKAEDIPSSTPPVISGIDQYPTSLSKLSSETDYSTTPFPLTSPSRSSIAVTSSPVEKTTTDQIITISPIELATDNVKDGASPSLVDEVTPAYDKQNVPNSSTLSPVYANIKDLMQKSVARNDVSELYDLIIHIITDNSSNMTDGKAIIKKDIDKTTDETKSATNDSLTKTVVPATSDDSSAFTTKQSDANTGDNSTTGDSLLESEAHTSDLTITINIPNDSDGTITIHVEVPDSTGNADTSGDDTVVLNIDTKNCTSTHCAIGSDDSTGASDSNNKQMSSDEHEENKNKLFDLASSAVVFNKTSDLALCDQLANNSAVNVIYIFQMQPLIQPIVERNKETTYYQNGTIVEEISETTWEDKDDPSHRSVKKKRTTHQGDKH